MQTGAWKSSSPKLINLHFINEFIFYLFSHNNLKNEFLSGKIDVNAPSAGTSNQKVSEHVGTQLSEL